MRGRGARVARAKGPAWTFGRCGSKFGDTLYTYHKDAAQCFLRALYPYTALPYKTNHKKYVALHPCASCVSTCLSRGHEKLENLPNNWPLWHDVIIILVWRSSSGRSCGRLRAGARATPCSTCTPPSASRTRLPNTHKEKRNIMGRQLWETKNGVWP